jgi:uroporphyrinogen decarboxylase
MNSRQRVSATLNHQEPDQVPISLGGSAHKLSDSRYFLLKEHFGIKEEGTERLTGAYLSHVNNRVLDALGTDIRHVHLRPPGDYRANIASDGSWTDEWGLTHRHVMGFYQLGGTPLASATIEDIQRYPWPDPHDPARIEGLERETLELYQNTDCAITAYRPTISGIFEMAHHLRGMEQLLMDTVLEKAFVDTLFTKLAEVIAEFYKVFLDVVGPYVQIVELADDLGTQQGPMISPKAYQELLQDKHALVVQAIKEKAPQAKVMLHSCGSIKAFIPYFIEAGFEVLNPLQPRAKDMEPAMLKAEFGDEIVFLGGVDVQQTMRGPVEGVKAEVRQRIEELGVGGGYILAPSHNFGDDIPIENILAFFEAAHKWGIYE